MRDGTDRDHEVRTVSFVLYHLEPLYCGSVPHHIIQLQRPVLLHPAIGEAKGCSEKCRSAMPRSAMVILAFETHHGSSYTGAADVEDDAVAATMLTSYICGDGQGRPSAEEGTARLDSLRERKGRHQGHAGSATDARQRTPATRTPATHRSPLPLPTPTNHHYTTSHLPRPQGSCSSVSAQLRAAW